MLLKKYIHTHTHSRTKEESEVAHFKSANGSLGVVEWQLMKWDIRTSKLILHCSMLLPGRDETKPDFIMCDCGGTARLSLIHYFDYVLVCRHWGQLVGCSRVDHLICKSRPCPGSTALKCN